MLTFLLFDRHFGTFSTLLKCAVYFLIACYVSAAFLLVVISLKNHNSSQEWARDLLFFDNLLKCILYKSGPYLAGRIQPVGRMFDTPDLNRPP